MPDANQNILLTAGVNKAEAAAAIKLLSDMQKAAESVATSMKTVGTGTSQQMQTAVASTRDLGAAMAATERAMSSQMIAGQLRRFGMTTGQVLGQGNPLQEVFRAGGDIAEFQTALKDLPRIFKEVKNSTFDFTKSFPDLINNAFQAVQGLPLLGGAARAGEAVVGGIAGTSGTMASLGGLVASLGPLAIAGGALALAFHSLSTEIETGNNEVKKAVAALDEYYNKISTATEDLLKTQNTRLEQQIANAQKERDQLKASAGPTEISPTVSQAQIWFNRIFNGPVLDRIKQLDDQIKVWNQTIDDNTKAMGAAEVVERSRVQTLITQTAAEVAFTEKMQTASKSSSESLKIRVNDIENTKWAIQGALDELDKQIASSNSKETFDTLSKQITDYRAQLTGLSREEQTLLDTIIPLVEAREREAKAINDLNKGTDQMVRALIGIADVNNQIAKTTEDRQRTDSRAAIEDSYKKRIEQARSNEELLSMQAQMHNTEVQMAKEAAKAAERHAADMARMDRDFMRSEMDATRRFQREQARADDQYARDRVKTLRDINERLLDLAGDGDVNGFIQAQRNGERQLRDMSENHDQQAKDAIAQFTQDRADALERFKIQKGDAEENYQLQRAETRKNNEETLQAQRDHYKKVQSESKTLQDELDALRLQWQKEDEARRRAEEDKASQERLDKLRLDVINAQALTNAYWDGVHNKLIGLLNAIGIGVPPAPTTGGSSGGGSHFHAAGLNYVPYDNYMAILHKGEAVIPASQNTRTGGGSQLSIGSITIGAGNNVTASDVEQALASMWNNIQTAFSNSRRVPA